MMDILILKCENGWMIVQRFINRAEEKKWIFKELPDLAEWIVSNVPRE